MIVDIFAAFLIICILILFAAGVSVAITYWFLSIPIFIVWFIWIYKRTQRRTINVQRNMTPDERYRQDRDLALNRDLNDMFKRAKVREKELRRS